MNDAAYQTSLVFVVSGCGYYSIPSTGTYKLKINGYKYVNYDPTDTYEILAETTIVVTDLYIFDTLALCQKNSTLFQNTIVMSSASYPLNKTLYDFYVKQIT